MRIFGRKMELAIAFLRESAPGGKDVTFRFYRYNDEDVMIMQVVEDSVVAEYQMVVETDEEDKPFLDAGMFGLSWNLFLSGMKTIGRSDEYQFEILEKTNRVLIRGDAGEVKLVWFQPDDGAVQQLGYPDGVIQIDPVTFRPVLDSVVKAAAGPGDVRGWDNVMVSVVDGAVRCVAVDGHRAHYCEMKDPDWGKMEGAKFVIPVAKARAVSDALFSSDLVFWGETKDRRWLFLSDGTDEIWRYRLYIRAGNADQFPDVWRLLHDLEADEPGKVLTVRLAIKDGQDAIKRIKNSLPSDVRVALFDFESEWVSIKHQSEAINAETGFLANVERADDDSDMSVLLNVSYLSDAMASAGLFSDLVVFEHGDPMGPVLLGVHHEEDVDWWAMVMPVRKE